MGIVTVVGIVTVGTGVRSYRSSQPNPERRQIMAAMTALLLIASTTLLLQIGRARFKRGDVLIAHRPYEKIYGGAPGAGERGLLAD